MAQNNSSNGIGFVGLLTIAFIVLKLTGFISGSWWWVFSPLWITVIFLISLILLFAIITTIIDIRKQRKGL